MKKNFSMPSLQVPDSGRSSTMQFRENPYGSLKYLEDSKWISILRRRDQATSYFTGILRKLAVIPR